MTENFNLQRALLRRLEESSEVSLIDNTQVNSILQEKPEGGGWPIVNLANARRLRSRLVVSHPHLALMFDETFMTQTGRS